MKKSHSTHWEFEQHFSNFGTKICKNKNGRRIWYPWEFLKMTPLLIWSTPESCNQIRKTHLNCRKLQKNLNTFSCKNRCKMTFSLLFLLKTKKLHFSDNLRLLTLYIFPDLPLWLWNFSTLEGVVLTLHILPPTYLFDFETSPHKMEGGIDITHTPHIALWLWNFSTLDGRWYWHYTYPPPTSLTWELQHTRLGVVLILHTQLCLWLWNFITLDWEWYWHYTYLPTYLFDFETSAHWIERGVVFNITHTPPHLPLWLWKLQHTELRGGWYWHYMTLHPHLTSLALKLQHIRWGWYLHIPPTYLFDFDTSAHWIGWG